MNQNSPAFETAKCLKSQRNNDANSIGSGILTMPNCANSQLSSPDMSDSHDPRKHSTSSTNLPNAFGSTNGEQQSDWQKTEQRLKIPSAIKVEQQSVSVLLIDCS